MKDILLKKPRARTGILFKVDREDDWFINVIHFELKSGKQTSNSLIIKKDFDTWMEMYTSKGWTISDSEAKNLKSAVQDEDEEDSPF